MGFKINIGDLTIQDPRSFGLFFWVVLVPAQLGTGGGRPKTCFNGARSPNGGFVNLEG